MCEDSEIIGTQTKVVCVVFDPLHKKNSWKHTTLYTFILTYINFGFNVITYIIKRSYILSYGTLTKYKKLVFVDTDNQTCIDINMFRNCVIFATISVFSKHKPYKNYRLGF